VAKNFVVFPPWSVSHRTEWHGESLWLTGKEDIPADNAESAENTLATEARLVPFEGGRNTDFFSV
jgi:hypothetical protein